MWAPVGREKAGYQLARNCLDFEERQIDQMERLAVGLQFVEVAYFAVERPFAEAACFAEPACYVVVRRFVWAVGNRLIGNHRASSGLRQRILSAVIAYAAIACAVDS